MPAVKKLSFIKMCPGGGLSLFYFIALISCLPAAYGQEVPPIEGSASGFTLFADTISTLTELPGYAQVTADTDVLDPDKDITIVGVVPTVICPVNRGPNCLVFTPSIDNIETYFSTERSLEEAYDYLIASTVRSTDYLAVSATLTLTVSYLGTVTPIEGIPTIETIPGATTYRLNLTEDLPELNDESGLVKDGFTTGFMAFSSITVTDRTHASVDDVVTGVEITSNCEEQNNCVRFTPLPSSFSGAVGEVQDFLREMVVGSANDLPFTTTLAVTVGVMRGPGVQFSNALEYRLTFVRDAPTLSAPSTERSGDVLGFNPFSATTVTEGQEEADTITVVVDFECPGGGFDCIDRDMSPIKGTAMQVQSSLRELEVRWATTYQEPREATATVSLNSSYQTRFDDVVSRESTPLVYRLSFIIPEPPQLSDDAGFNKDGFATGFMAFSSIKVTEDGEFLGAERVTSVRITADCGQLENDCVRYIPLPSSLTGITASGFQSSLRSMVIGSTNDSPFTATLTVTVGFSLRGSEVRFSTAVYSLTSFSGAPTLSAPFTEISGDVLESTPFSSITVTDDPGEADTITSVMIDFDCSGGGSDCIGRDMSPIKGTAMQVQSSLRELEVRWVANYLEPREATATIYLNSSYRTPFGDVVSRRSTPLVYRLSFIISDLPPMLADASGLAKTGPVDGFAPFTEITLRDAEIRGGTESVTGIQTTVMCVGGAPVCTAFVGDQPEDFEGGNLQQAEDFLRGLQVRSRFASYSAELSVSVNTVLRELSRQSNTLVYTLTFPTPGRLSDDRPRLIDPAFATDLGVDDPNDLDAVANAVAAHCGDDYFEDSDGDGVPNNVEAQLGTDCRNDDPENVAGDGGRPLVTVETSGAQVLDKLPFAGSLSELGIECRGCVEIFFLEKQAVCTSGSTDSVLGNGSIAFPGVNQSSCYQTGYYSSSVTAVPSLTGTIFPVPTWSQLYVLGIDRYGNWSVSNSGALETKRVYTLPVLSLGPDLYASGDVANITVEFRGRWTPASPDLSLPTADALTFTLDVNGTPFRGSLPNPVYRGTATVPVDVSGIDAGGTLIVSLDGSNSPFPRFTVGRSTLTVVKGEAPPFITIGLMEEGNSDPVSVVSLDDEGAGYSLNVGPTGTASTLAITTGDGTMVLVSGQTDNLSNLLAQLSDLPGGYAILKVRASLSGNTREAEFPVFGSLESAESGAAWTREVVDRGIVIAGCSPFPCDDDNLAASVNLGQESYLSQVVASSIRGFAASFDRVREILNDYVSGQLLDSDLSSIKLLTDVISYSGFASNVAQDRASFVLDLRHKPFSVDGRLVKRIRVGDDYVWRGVDNFEADGSVSYTLRRDSTCPDPDAEAAWSDTDNGLIPASVRCVRLTIVDGGLYDGNADGYFADPIFGVSDADFDPSLLAHAGGDGGGSDSTWIYVLAVLSGLLYGGSSGIWMLPGLVLVLALSLRRKRVSGVQTRLKR